jgi:hypothetical protein
MPQFNKPNDRVFYACQAVFIKEKQTVTTGNNDSVYTAEFLEGVQSVGVSRSQDKKSLLDVGRFQQMYGFYGKQTFEINISRTISRSTKFFYNIDSLSTFTYETSHILNQSNIGFSGFTNSLRNWDISLVYGRDAYESLQGQVDSGDTDANQGMVTTYRSCLLTNITYSITAGGTLEETITLITRIGEQNPEDNLSLIQTVSPQSGEVVVSKDLNMATDGSGALINTVLPRTALRYFDIGNELNSQKIYAIQSIDVNCTIDYSDILDVGQWRGSSVTSDGADAGRDQNLFRQVALPVAVTANITGVVRGQYRADGSGYQDYPNTDTTFSAADGSEVSLLDNQATPILPSYTSHYNVNESIRLVFDSDSDYLQLNLGDKNYLTNIEFSGGDTGGGNVEATLSYQNDNSDFIAVKNSSVLDINSSSNTY